MAEDAFYELLQLFGTPLQTLHAFFRGEQDAANWMDVLCFCADPSEAPAALEHATACKASTAMRAREGMPPRLDGFLSRLLCALHAEEGTAIERAFRRWGAHDDPVVRMFRDQMGKAGGWQGVASTLLAWCFSTDAPLLMDKYETVNAAWGVLRNRAVQERLDACVLCEWRDSPPLQVFMAVWQCTLAALAL